MIKLFHKLMTAALPVLLCGTLLTGCTDDKYNKINDLFQPRFVLEEPEVKGNSISLVWYKVNDAVSYTVEYYRPVPQQLVHGSGNNSTAIVCR